MHDDLPPLLALQAFEAAARHENFAVAAKELNLSQSAVSHRVRLLERHLGHQLFERLPRGLRLTESAKAYLPSVRQAFEDLLGSTSGVFGSAGNSTLIVRAPVSYVSLWLTREIDRFSAAFPGISVRLTSSIWADKLATGEADIDLRLGYGHWPEYKADFLFRDRLIAVCSSTTLPKLKGRNRAAAIADCALVHLMGTEDYWPMFFSQFGIKRPEDLRDVRTDSSITAAELACSSHRIALLQKRLAEPYVSERRLALASDFELGVQQALYVLMPTTNNRRKPEAILFREWLFDEFQDDQAAG